MGKMLKKINKAQVNDSVNVLRKLKSYVKDSKEFFKNLEVILNIDDSTIDDVRDLYIEFKDKLGVK